MSATDTIGKCLILNSKVWKLSNEFNIIIIIIKCQENVNVKGSFDDKRVNYCEIKRITQLE